MLTFFLCVEFGLTMRRGRIVSTELTSSALLLSINFTIPTPLFVAKDFFERRRCERSFGVFTFPSNAGMRDR